MALSPELTKLLNDFADSQPALRLPTQPAGKSNPKIGDAINEAIATATGEDASGLTYTPGTPSDWSPAPAQGAEALDQLAARTEAVETVASGAASAAGTAQSTAEDAENQAYTAGTPADWLTSAPTTLKAALDRLASAVEGLLAAPIP